MKAVHPCSNHSVRNIVTHHAEDGSGVGSAIIAGKLLVCPRVRSFMFFSDDEAEKGSRNSPRVSDNRMIAPKDVLLACGLCRI